MKMPLRQFNRSVVTVLLGAFLLPGTALLLPVNDAYAGRGVAVRGPRGGAAAAVRTPVRRPVARRPVVAPRGPASIHGTARRTARRTTRRLYTMPRGYTMRMVGGVNYYYYGGLYYQPYYEGSNVVYVQVVFD